MATDTQTILRELARPFSAEEVDWRVGATKQDKTQGLALAYCDARTVMDRFDAVCGALWQNRYIEARGGKIVICEISLFLDGQWLTRSNGAGDTDHEPEKGALSDAFKRAAYLWGVGRFLYAIESPWVDILPRGKSFAIKDNERGKLRKIVEKAIREYDAASPRRYAEAPEEEGAPAGEPPRAQGPRAAAPSPSSGQAQGQVSALQKEQHGDALAADLRKGREDNEAWQKVLQDVKCATTLAEIARIVTKARPALVERSKELELLFVEGAEKALKVGDAQFIEQASGLATRLQVKSDEARARLRAAFQAARGRAAA